MRIAYRGPMAAVPDDDRAAAVLALGDVALELEIVERMVFGANRKPLLARHQARSSRHRPALEHAVELEPQIVMQPARRVLLHHELPAGAGPQLRLGLPRRAENAPPATGADG